MRRGPSGGGGVFLRARTRRSSSFVPAAAEATETTQPDKERNSCLQLTALRLTAFHLPRRLSLAEQWLEAGWLSPESGAAAGGGAQTPIVAGDGGRGGAGWCLSFQVGKALRSLRPAADKLGEDVEGCFPPWTVSHSTDQEAASTDDVTLCFKKKKKKGMYIHKNRNQSLKH